MNNFINFGLWGFFWLFTLFRHWVSSLLWPPFVYNAFFFLLLRDLNLRFFNILFKACAFILFRKDRRGGFLHLMFRGRDTCRFRWLCRRRFKNLSTFLPMLDPLSDNFKFLLSNLPQIELFLRFLLWLLNDSVDFDFRFLYLMILLIIFYDFLFSLFFL